VCLVQTGDAFLGLAIALTDGRAPDLGQDALEPVQFRMRVKIVMGRFDPPNAGYAVETVA